MRNIIIGALSVGAIYLLYMAYKNNQESLGKKEPKVPNVPSVPEEPAFACPEGEVLCDKKPRTCYNPSARYIVDPCM